jgi:transcriptional regulator with XRE-family HTH domain
MIRNKREYDEARARLAQAQDQFDAYARELAGEGLSAEEVHRALAPSRVLLRQSEAELTRYERLQGGDLGVFTTVEGVIPTAEQFGRLLIGARIARGWSQRKLAQKLGIHESQVSRDENNDYHGVTLARAFQILDALGVEVSVRRPRLQADPDETLVDPWVEKLGYNGEDVFTPTLAPGLVNCTALAN